MNNITDNNINSIMDDVEEQPPWQERDTESININRNVFAEFCQSSAVFIFLSIIALIPILQIVIGWRYSNACPLKQLISHYSIVAGIVGLVLVILISIIQIMTRTFAKKVVDDTIDKTNPNRATMLVGCGVCSIMCINFSLFIFLIGWSVVGWVWVIEVWHKVQYRRAENNDYCHPILYQFTFSVLLLTTTFKLIFFSFVCKKTCIKMTTKRTKDTVASDDF